MKHIFIVIAVVMIYLLPYSCFSQTNSDVSILNDDDSYVADSIPVDTLGRNSIGLNVFPAFGMLGGGILPNTKICFQYKRYFDRLNLRAGVSFIDYYRPIDKIDYIGRFTDTTFNNGEMQVSDSLKLRRFGNDIFSYDFRFGIEAAFPKENLRLHFGAGVIAGYHYYGERYFHYNIRTDSLPVERVNILRNAEEVGNIKNHYLKLGFDISIGVDIFINETVTFTIQYTPELAYYSLIERELSDPYDYYVNLSDSKINFRPDYIDFLVSIRF